MSLGMVGRPKARGAGLRADRSEYLASVAPDALIATVNNPYGAGTTYATFGTVPSTLKLGTDGKILAGAGAQTVGQASTIVIEATNGSRMVREPITLTARAAAPAPTPAPAFSSGPAITPTTGSAGDTFTCTETVTNGTVTARSWIVDNTEIGTNKTVVGTPGQMYCRVTANGPGGTTIANTPTITVSAQQAKPVVEMFIEGGNSHGGGRALKLDDTAEGNWPANVYQYKIDGTFEQLSAGTRKTLDQVAGGSYTPATQISPFYWFIKEYAAANSGVPRFVVTPGNKNATAFKDGSWNAAGAPSNLLGQLIARHNAAWDALVAQGFAPKLVAYTFHAADPDYDDAANFVAHRENIDAMIDYVRANARGITASTPILIGSGMVQSQVGTVNNYLAYQANYMGVAKRKPYVALLDTTNPRYGYSDNLPVVALADGVHENYLGLQTLGKLRMNGLARAARNANPRAPFHNLSFASRCVAFWDMRVGGGLDMSGNGRTLVRSGTASGAPVFVYEPLWNDFVWKRTNTSSQLWAAQATPLPASYSKAIYVAIDLTRAQAFMSDTDGGGNTANGHRFQISTTGGVIQAGHGAMVNLTAPISGSGLVAGQYALIVVTYDAPTMTMKIYVNGVEKASAGLIGGHSALNLGYLGAANAAGGNALVGNIGMGWVVSGALTAAEVVELYVATQKLGDAQ